MFGPLDVQPRSYGRPDVKPSSWWLEISTVAFLSGALEPPGVFPQQTNGTNLPTRFLVVKRKEAPPEPPNHVLRHGDFLVPRKLMDRVTCNRKHAIK